MATPLADDLPNATVRSFGNFLLGYRGADDDTWDRLRIPTTWSQLTADAAGSGLAVCTGAASKNCRALVLCVSFDADVSFALTKEDATVLWQGPLCKAGVPFVFQLGNGILNPTADNDIEILTSGAANCTGSVGYCYEA